MDVRINNMECKMVGDLAHLLLLHILKSVLLYHLTEINLFKLLQLVQLFAICLQQPMKVLYLILNLFFVLFCFCFLLVRFVFKLPSLQLSLNDGIDFHRLTNIGMIMNNRRPYLVLKWLLGADIWRWGADDHVVGLVVEVWDSHVLLLGDQHGLA